MNERIDSSYVNIKINLKFLTTSDARNKILISLKTGKKRLKDLKNEIRSDASIIIHSIRDMEKENLVIEDEGAYHLTSIGELLSQKLYDLMNTIYILQTNRDFWLNHDITGIPIEFLGRINELKEYQIITSNLKNIWKTYAIYFELIKNAGEFKGVSPIFHPRFPQMIE